MQGEDNNIDLRLNLSSSSTSSIISKKTKARREGMLLKAYLKNMYEFGLKMNDFHKYESLLKKKRKKRKRKRKIHFINDKRNSKCQSREKFNNENNSSSLTENTKALSPNTNKSEYKPISFLDYDFESNSLINNINENRNVTNISNIDNHSNNFNHIKMQNILYNTIDESNIINKRNNIIPSNPYIN